MSQPDGIAFNQRQGSTIFLATQPVVSTCDVKDAAADRDPTSAQNYVNVTLSALAADKFEKFTAKNVKNRAAFVVDGVVVSAPIIQVRIPGGHMQFEAASWEEAQDLERRLRSHEGCPR